MILNLDDHPSEMWVSCIEVTSLKGTKSLDEDLWLV